MRKSIIEFFRFENRGIKIAQVNSILIPKSINLQLYTLILYGFGLRCDQRLFSVLSLSTQLKSICGTIHGNNRGVLVGHEWRYYGP